MTETAATLYRKIQMLRDKRDASTEDVLDAAVSATTVLGDELVERVRGTSVADGLAAIGQALVDAHHVVGKNLTSVQIAELLATEAARDPLAITLDDCALGARGLDALVDVDRPSLRRLEIRKCRLGPEALAAILATPAARRLDRLALGNNVIGAAGAQLLADTELPALRSLEVGYTRMALDEVARLVNSPQRKHLRVLQLSTDKLGNLLGRTLAAGKALAALTSLRIINVKLGNSGIADLVAAPPFKLRRLTLFEAGAGEVACAAIAASPAMRELAELRFRYDAITGKALASLARSPNLRELRALQISQCRLDDAGLDALLASDLQLESLDLGSNPRLSPTTLARIARAPNMQQLRHLSLYGQKLGERGLAELAEIDGLPLLETLGLENCELTDTALAQLARWPQFAHLRRLHVGTNPIFDTGLAHLAAVSRRRLEVIELYQTKARAIVPGAHRIGTLWHGQFPPWFD